MNFFWIYEIPNWLFFIICNTFFVLSSLGIFFLVQKYLVPILRLDDSSNDLLSYFLSALGAFYSITLGLIAVGTWENFDNTSSVINSEAASINALYRDVGYYPDTVAIKLKTGLKDYTKFIIYEAWPQQRKGIIPSASEYINRFQKELYTFKPQDASQEIIHAEALSQFNTLNTIRRLRLSNVDSGLPAVLWMVIFSGALLLIILCGMFIDENKRAHKFLLSFLGLIIGTSVFLIAAMDFPYRGEFSVSPEPFVLIYEGTMSK
jgi:hypothetical protein